MRTTVLIDGEPAEVFGASQQAIGVAWRAWLRQPTSELLTEDGKDIDGLKFLDYLRERMPTVEGEAPLDYDRVWWFGPPPERYREEHLRRNPWLKEDDAPTG